MHGTTAAAETPVDENPSFFLPNFHRLADPILNNLFIKLRRKILRYEGRN